MVEPPQIVLQKPASRQEPAGAVGNNRPSVLGARYLQSSDPFEMRDAKVGAPARRLAEYLASEGAWDIGAERYRSLTRVLGILKAYVADGQVPGEATLVTLDAANQRVKAKLGTEWKNAHIKLGPSSSGDYMISDALLAVADALSYYIAPDGDKVKVWFAAGPSGESQIKVGGYSREQMQAEAKGAVVALLDIAAAELLSNGTWYAISMRDGYARLHYEQPE